MMRSLGKVCSISGQNISLPRLACLAVAAMTAMFWCAGASAESLMDQVLNAPSDPNVSVYAVQPYSITANTATQFVAGGTSAGYFTTANFYNFNYPDPVTVSGSGISAVDGHSLPVTAIFDPTNTPNPGVFALNIDQATPSNDYLVEQIDTGYSAGTTSSPQMTNLFLSASLLGFGPVTSAPNEYWFAFQGQGNIIGGIVNPNAPADVKTFAFVPAPPEALAGLALMLCLAGWQWTKRRLSPAEIGV
jgi:hypothetical protein